MVKRVARPPTLTAAVVDSIREAIFRGELRPGEPLREAELSASLDVSRGTVREALRLLQEEKVVEIFPHRGASVTQLCPRTVSEAYTLRALLEPYAVRLAVEKGAYNEKDLAELEALIQRMAECEQRGDVLETARAELEFHWRLCQPSDHRLLLETFNNLRSLTMLCLLNIKLYSSNLPSDELHHHQVLDAVRQGDPAHAAEIVQEHINDSCRVLMTGMEELEMST